MAWKAAPTSQEAVYLCIQGFCNGDIYAHSHVPVSDHSPRSCLVCLGVHGAFAVLNCVTPFFIVDDLPPPLASYHSTLGFGGRSTGGGDGNTGDVWPTLGRH